MRTFTLFYGGKYDDKKKPLPDQNYQHLVVPNPQPSPVQPFIVWVNGSLWSIRLVSKPAKTITWNLKEKKAICCPQARPDVTDPSRTFYLVPDPSHPVPKIELSFEFNQQIFLNWIDPSHTCKKRVMMRWGYFGQKKIAEKCVNRDKM